MGRKLKTGEAIEKLIGLQAKFALVQKEGKESEIPVEEVKTMKRKPDQRFFLYLNR